LLPFLKKNNFKGSTAWFKTLRKSVNKGYSVFVKAVTTTPVPKITKIETKTPAVKPTPIKKTPVKFTPAKYVYVYQPQWRWVSRTKSYLTYYWTGFFQYYWYMSCWSWWFWTWCNWFNGWRWFAYPYWYWASYTYMSHEFY